MGGLEIKSKRLFTYLVGMDSALKIALETLKEWVWHLAGEDVLFAASRDNYVLFSGLQCECHGLDHE